MEELKKFMELQIEKFKEEIKKYSNVHKANPDLISNIDINGQNIRSLCSIGIGKDNSRSILITPYNSSNINEIMAEVRKKDLGGVQSLKSDIILTLSPVTKAYIDDLNKKLKEKLEQFKIAIRQKRQQKFNDLKAEPSKDVKNKLEKKYQEIIDDCVKNIDNLFNQHIKTMSA